MLITRECDYAVRVVRALAPGKRMSVGEICEKESITAPFAYKILKKLQKAEIVRGFRGVHGGYSLRRPAEELTLYDIYTAIDPEFLIIDCLEPEYKCPRNSQDELCTVHCELCKIQKELCRLLGEKTLKEIFKAGTE
ncbi:MAG: Rrf2 family transcriptional regulator [Eubacteriales bacterium]|nr:Rrf2 family transcriptional regulator [Eubacteriales bacterium]